MNLENTYISPIFAFSMGGVLGGPLSRTKDKIRSFRNLPQGWNYGRGGPAAEQTVQIAQDYLWMFMTLGFVETDAFPGVDGEIMVTAYLGRHCVEVTVEPDRSFAVGHQIDR